MRPEKRYKFTGSKRHPRELVWVRSCIGNVIQLPTSQVDSEGTEVEQFDEFVLRVKYTGSLPIVMRMYQHIVDYDFSRDPGRHSVFVQDI